MMRGQQVMKGLILGLGLAVALPGVASAQVVRYYHLDAVGNVRALTDEAGNVVERHDYLPFGEVWNPQPGTQPLRPAKLPLVARATLKSRP
jgi:uncharacterized protein RhaS with RHS repeats